MKKVTSTALMLLTTVSTAFAADNLSVSMGNTKATLNGLLQTWALNDTTSASAPANFILRRAEIQLSGTIGEPLRYLVMIDPAKAITTSTLGGRQLGDGKILQDLAVGVTVAPGVEVVAGQFITPATAEGSDNPRETLLPEMSYSGRAFGFIREPGAMVSYKNDYLQARAMVSNGTGPNMYDFTNRKDLTLRVDAPIAGVASAGAFTTAGDFNYSQHARWGLNGRLDMDNLTVRAEGVHSLTGGEIMNSWNLESGYTIADAFQPVARFEGASNDAFTGWAASAGLNYQVVKNHGKVSFSYSYLRNMEGNYGRPTPANLNNAGGSVFNLAFQASL